MYYQTRKIENCVESNCTTNISKKSTMQLVGQEWGSGGGRKKRRRENWIWNASFQFLFTTQQGYTNGSWALLRKLTLLRKLVFFFFLKIGSQWRLAYAWGASTKCLGVFNLEALGLFDSIFDLDMMKIKGLFYFLCSLLITILFSI